MAVLHMAGTGREMSSEHRAVFRTLPFLGDNEANIHFFLKLLRASMKS